MLGLMKRIWKGWKRFAHGIVAFQNGLFVVIIFAFGIGPAALLARLLRKRLLDVAPPPEKGWPDAGTWWEPLTPAKVDPDSAQRPF